MSSCSRHVWEHTPTHSHGNTHPHRSTRAHAQAIGVNPGLALWGPWGADTLKSLRQGGRGRGEGWGPRGGGTVG